MASLLRRAEYVQRHTGASLRAEVNARALAYAAAHALPYEQTTGRMPSTLFREDEQGSHGNFHRVSYGALCAQPDWARRLRKAHTASLRALPRADWRWRELDCACSSDALLMNIFCHPETLASTRVAALLGVARNARPSFGLRPRVPLSRSLFDTTEVDMQLGPSPIGAGTLLVEAKLTESDLQTARPALVERYRDLHEVFHVEHLPRTCALSAGEVWDEELACMVPDERGVRGRFTSYQLIRGALAAHATGANYCVLLDERRTDLIEAWYRVQQAVRLAELRPRLQLLTWQELAAALPSALADFLAHRFGIYPA